MKSIGKFVSVFMVIGLAQLLTASCYYDNEQALYHINLVDCSKINAGFTTDVMPIFMTHCATPACHNSTGAGGVVLQTYDEIKAKVDRIKQRVLIDKTMPPSGALSTSELNIIQCWINSGALNN